MSKQLVEDFMAFKAEKAVHYRFTRDEERIIAHILQFLEKPDKTNVECLDEHCLESNGDKSRLIELIKEFYAYYEEKYGEEVPTDLYPKQPIDNPLLRQIEIVKYLQKERTTGDIARHFCVSDQTVRTDLRALKDGISILGNEFKIEEKTTGRNRKKHYESTAHPVLLMLNLTEIKALLIELQKLSEEKNTDLFNFVAERIKAQLTPYALQKVCGTEEDIRKPQNAWNDERQMVERADSSAYDQLTYCLKASKPCDIRFVLDGKEYNLVQAQVGYGSGGFELVHDGHVYKIQKEGIISVHVDYA